MDVALKSRMQLFRLSPYRAYIPATANAVLYIFPWLTVGYVCAFALASPSAKFPLPLRGLKICFLEDFFVFPHAEHIFLPPLTRFYIYSPDLPWVTFTLSRSLQPRLNSRCRYAAWKSTYLKTFESRIFMDVALKSHVPFFFGHKYSCHRVFEHLWVFFF